MGLCSEIDFVEALTLFPIPGVSYPPSSQLSGMLPLSSTAPARMAHLPLQLSSERHAVVDRSAQVKSQHPFHGTPLDSARQRSGVNPTWAVIDEYGITKRDIAQVYFSPHVYNDAFEVELSMQFDTSRHPAGGMQFKTYNGRLTLGNMTPATVDAKIRNWRSRIRNAWLVQINSKVIASLKDVHEALQEATLRREKNMLFTLLSS